MAWDSGEVIPERPLTNFRRDNLDTENPSIALLIDIGTCQERRGTSNTSQLWDQNLKGSHSRSKNG